MKGAKCSLMSRLHSLFLANLFGRSCGLSRSTSRRTSTGLPTSASSSVASSAASGMRSASLVTPFVVVFTCFSLLFPTVASANPLTIGFTAWNAFITAINIIDAGISSQAAVTSAEDLQVVASNLRIWTGTASQAQTIAQELERISGYDIDSGNHINTVYGLTGNGSYDQEQICPDCAGGYVATSTGLEVCDTCGGDGMYYWDTVPYTSTHECMLYLASWIEYLSATRTDWSGLATSTSTDSSSTGYALFSLLSNRMSGDDSNAFFYANSATFSNGSIVSGSGSRLSYSNVLANRYFTNDARIYLHPDVVSWVNNKISLGYSVVFGVKASAHKTTNMTFYVVLCDSFSEGSLSAFGHMYYLVNGSQYSCGAVTAYYDSDGVFYVSPSSVPSNSSSVDYCTMDYSKAVESVSTVSDTTASDTDVSWGTDIDWYSDTSDAGAAGGTTVTNEGDTIYNSETNTYTTNNNIDVEPITQRLDVLNAINAQIGIDLRTLNDSMFKELNDLEWWLQRIYYAVATINNTLESIRSDMANLDRSTNDLVDLSSLESGVSAFSGDIDALLSAVTGSHGADALGLYGRLDTVLNWLDDYAPVDVSGIQAILEDWPDYPVFDDSDLLNAITGSHGADLLGLFGRFDNLLAWVDDYQFPDFTGISDDVAAILRDWDNFMLVLEDWPDYPVTDLGNIERYFSELLGYSTVLYGGVTYSFTDLLYNIWLDLGQFCDDFVSYWNGVFGKLDGIVSAIERLDFKTAYPSSPNVPRPTQGDLRERIDWSEWDNAVSTLSHKFPFVIINDIVLIFTALTRPAVTPVFDLPVPNPSDWSSPYLLHVDLSDFDSVAAVMRVGITLWVIARVSRRTLALWTSNEGSAV